MGDCKTDRTIEKAGVMPESMYLYMYVNILWLHRNMSLSSLYMCI